MNYFFWVILSCLFLILNYSPSAGFYYQRAKNCELCQPDDTLLVKSDLPGKRRPLFNQIDLKGWHSFRKQEAGRGWSVNDGSIHFDPDVKNGGGDLVSDDVYENFILTLEWKIGRGGNSGILFGVQEGDDFNATWTSGPEMQVLDNKNASDNKKASHLAGSLYDLIGADPSTVHSAGEWNKVKIKKRNNHLTFWMNGHKVVNVIIGSPEWNELVLNSKFKDIKEFGAYSKGHIAFQAHGGEVWYRDIYIKVL